MEFQLGTYVHHLIPCIKLYIKMAFLLLKTFMYIQTLGILSVIASFQKQK